MRTVEFGEAVTELMTNSKNRISAMRSVEDIKTENTKFVSDCKQVFGSGIGKELLAKLKRIYCEGQLYDDSERTTAYLIGQRDLILELIHNVEE